MPTLKFNHETNRPGEDATALVGPPLKRGSSTRLLHHFFEKTADSQPLAPALDCAQHHLTYAALEKRANQLAHHMQRLGVGAGSRVGLLLERSLHTYVALLATLKCGAAFVPLDPSFPADRVAFIADDADLTALATTKSFEAVTTDLHCRILFLDGEASTLASESSVRLPASYANGALAYIIYTSGTTGRPKGVAVTHASVCNFLAACLPIYGVAAADRVYQGMTLAFDFAIEEVWPTFAAGATLVAGPNDHRRLGAGLTDFLIDRKITVLACVPTLLATLERDVPTLKTLLVGGEACPRDLVERWSRTGRRMLNTYGPTETTVTATWTKLLPGKPVTIGRPLPTYTAHILDDELRPVPAGESGEICIGGPSVAVGYIKRPDLTAERFVADPFDPRPGGRLYRTGDLGRLTSDQEIEYLGRIDSQVKIRGYRIELSEIEAVLLEHESVKSAIVNLHSADGIPQELVAYLTVTSGEDPAELRQRLHAGLRRRLPSYMVPAFLEILDELPMLPSGKAERARLPAPVSARLAADTGATVVPPATPLEKELAAAWSRVFGHPDISVEADFFLDLGGHSLFAAMVISALRRNPALHHLAMADLYNHPTIRGLGQYLESHPAHAATPHARLRHGNARVLACGLVQFTGLYALFTLLAAPVGLVLTDSEGASLAGLAGSGALIMGIMVLTNLTLPVVGKWLLLGRVRAGRYPLWGWYYCRWWLARKCFALAPLDYLAGSPLLAPYLRLFGARVGKGCHLGTAKLQMPDLLDIGDHASIGYGADLEPFLVEDGWLNLAPIRLGSDTFVGSNAVIMLGAQVGDGACVGEQSLVARDQDIPPGEVWTGSPSARAAADSQLIKMGEQESARSWSPLLGAGFLAAFLVLEALPWLLIAPGLLIARGCQRGLVAGTGVASHRRRTVCPHDLCRRRRRQTDRHAVRPSGPRAVAFVVWSAEMVYGQIDAAEPRCDQFPLCHTLHGPLAALIRRTSGTPRRGFDRLQY